MNEEAKKEHVLECLAHARQEMKWTPSIVVVNFLENCINTEFFEIKYVAVKNGKRGVSTKEIEYIPFEDPKDLWTRIVKLVINDQKADASFSVSGVFETEKGPKEFTISSEKEYKYPCSAYCEELGNKHKFKTCDDCKSWYKKIIINKATGVGMSEIKDMEKGTKFDDGKPRLGEMIMDFRKPLLEVCKVWEFGAKKYKKSNWKKVKNGADRYTNALARHFAAEMDEVTDAETKLHHAIHVAWNALARLYFIIKDGE